MLFAYPVRVGGRSGLLRTAGPPNAQFTQRIDLIEDHHCGTVQIQ
jgi:hypothetical protein